MASYRYSEANEPFRLHFYTTTVNAVSISVSGLGDGSIPFVDSTPEVGPFGDLEHSITHRFISVAHWRQT